MRKLLMPGENQAGGHRVSWAFAAANISSPGDQAVVRQRIGDQLRNFEIQRRAADQHHERNIANVAGWTDLAQRAQGVGDKDAFFSSAANVSSAR